MTISNSDAPLNQVIDSFFNSSLSDFLGADFTVNQPAVNIIENDEDFSIEVAAPGFTKKDFNIELIENKLKIGTQTAEQKTGDVTEKVEAPYARREFNFNSFSRSFHLPENVDTETIVAAYKNGLLKISIQKTQASSEMNKSIKIN